MPKYLADLGIKQVIPPLVTKTGKLWARLASLKAILYPYIHGHNGVDDKPSDNHWVEFESAIKRRHSLSIPSSITQDVSRETFSFKWRETVKAFLGCAENEVFKEPVAVQMALFLKSKRWEILKIIERAEELALAIQKQPLEYSLCHGDRHGCFLMVDQEKAINKTPFIGLTGMPLSLPPRNET